MIIIPFFIFGLLIGSFISAITWRVPRNEGFVKGRSYCDSCRKELLWYDNIPLFSYLFYFGKSRCCRKKISPRYFLIEITTTTGAVIFWLVFHNLFFILLFFITLCIFIIDLEHQIIPDELTWIFLFCVLIYSFTFGNLFSGFLFAFFFLFLYLVTRGRGMGMGDVKLAIPIGYIVGLSDGFIWLLATFLTGGFIACILLLAGKAGLKTKIAFGPFMIFAFWLVLIYTHAKIY